MAMIKLEVWDLEQALELIRELQPQVKEFNYHICLGGSVLNTGWSTKDLDLYFLPLDNGMDAQLHSLADFLEHKLGESVDISGERYRNSTSCYEYKLKFTYQNKRIDLFIIKE